MKLLRILCKGEDFYELCKHNYYPKKKKTYHYDNTANKGLQCNLIFKNETDAFKKISMPTLKRVTEIPKRSRV